MRRARLFLLLTLFLALISPVAAMAAERPVPERAPLTLLALLRQTLVEAIAQLTDSPESPSRTVQDLGLGMDPNG
jgi:hypothetical protein